MASAAPSRLSWLTWAANVIVHGNRNRAGAERVTVEIADLGVEAKTLLCDLSDLTSLESFVAQAWQIAPLDIWVNNAGVDVLTGEAADWPFDRKMAALWEVDVRATVRAFATSIGTRT